MEYSEYRESNGGSQCTRTELLVTFSIVRFLGGRGTETKTKKICGTACCWLCSKTHDIHPVRIATKPEYSTILDMCSECLHFFL